MTRQVLIAASLLLTLLGYSSPLSAQGGNLRQLIAARPDLSTFSVFIDASLGRVRNTIDGPETLTIFAPTDTAFSNLASFLDVPLEELLQNPEGVSQLVEYHILDGAFTARQLATEFSGEVVQTRLPLAFVSVRTTDAGGISLNNLVEIVEFDIQGNNGFIHIINDVLLNRIVAETLQEQLNSARPLAAITPNPDSTALLVATPTPAVASTEVANGTGFVRIAHFADEVDALDIYLNDERIATRLDYATIAPYTPVPAGSYQVILTAVNALPSDTQLLSQSITIEADTFYTLPLLPTMPLALSILATQPPEVSDDEAYVQIYHAAETVGPVRYTLDNVTLSANFANGDLSALTLGSSVYDPRIVVGTMPSETLLDPLPLSVWGGAHYFLALVGPADDLQWVGQATSAQTLAILREGRGLRGMPTSQE